jgi:hypothetical protein
MSWEVFGLALWVLVVFWNDDSKRDKRIAKLEEEVSRLRGSQMEPVAAPSVTPQKAEQAASGLDDSEAWRQRNLWLG